MLDRPTRQGDIVAASRTGISGFLARVRTLVYRHEARRAALYAAAALGALALVLPMLGQIVSGRTGAIALVSAGGVLTLAVLIAAVVLGWVVPRRRFERDADLARWVGGRHKPGA